MTRRAPLRRTHRLAAHRRGGRPPAAAIGLLGLSLGFASLAVAPLAGCKTTEPPVVAPPRDEPLAPLTYRRAAERYNAHVADLDRLWSRSVVAVRWVTEDGKPRKEQGEGHFVFIPPRRVVLTVGKLGKVMLWAGSNDTRYWLIDNQGDGTAYVGRHRAAGAGDADGGARPPGPLPFKPDDIPFLLGLRPLPVPEADDVRDVEADEADEANASGGPEPEGPAGRCEIAPDNAAYLVTPPGGRVRLWLEPERLLPVRVELFEEGGDLAALGELTRHRRLEDAEGSAALLLPTDAWLYPANPDAPGRPDREQSLHLLLSDLSTGAGRFREGAFRFETLLRIYEPERVVRLDAPTRRVAPLPPLAD